MRRPPTVKIFSFLLILSIACILASLAIGSVTVSSEQLWAILTGKDTGIEAQIVSELRWPRTATAFLTGALLGLAGVLMQVLLRNPLADPYVLGISGGAATGALLSITFGLSSQWIESSAFGGAIFSMLLVYILSHHKTREHSQQLLLTGIILAAGWGAVINLLLILSDAQNIHSMLFWLMGDLSLAATPHPAVLLLLLLALLTSWILARDLNLLSQGEHKAMSLGSPVGLVRKIIFVIAALCTAIAVSMAGTVGFVGLVIPHLLRLAIGSNHRLLLPAAVLAGGSLLVLADLGARTLLAPQQLPVGVITALIGVPVFIYLLKHRHH